MRRATKHQWRIAVGLGVTLLVVAIGFAVVVNGMGSNDALPDNGVDTVLGEAADAGAVATSPAASPSPAPSSTATRSPSLTPSPTPSRDRTAPTIGEAVSQYTGIWTEYWCSSGPRRSQIQIPVADETDAVESLEVVVRYVLRRGDNQETFPLGEVRLTPSGNPVVLTIGPYPGPNAAYASTNVIDMTVNATDEAGNRSTRTFVSFMTFSECKQG
jgi:hypothetical protein